MSWFTQWLPQLPSIDLTLPSSLQRRFISFALRQTLGHFLQPGQLDVLQIDSQIGSGYVQIRDVELNNEAINALISGLPVQLHDGSIGKVTARIPWPNPLTSSVGLSLESLHLTFHLAATPATTFPAAFSSLAESVASVADTFIHEELSAAEESSLRESIHTDLSASLHGGADNVPGGLDPFMTDTEDTSHEGDPPGVSIFATLLERLLSRFYFDAADIRITLVHPGHASFTMIIPDIAYGTNSDISDPAASAFAPGSYTAHDPSVRTLKISSFNVTTRCLRPAGLSSPLALPTSPSSYPASQLLSPVISPSTPHSSSSDIDEDTQMLMSQSLAALPPRPVSPSSSVSGSMYQSALSTTLPIQVPETVEEESDSHSLSSATPEQPTDEQFSAASAASAAFPLESDHAPLQIDTRELEDETLVSLRSDPILIHLTTPSTSSSRTSRTPTNAPSHSHSPAEKGAATPPPAHNVDPMKVEITAGVLSIALKARHIRSLLDVAQVWSSHNSPQKAMPQRMDATKQGHSILDTFEITMRLRGVVLLLSPSTSLVDDQGLNDYWMHPLVPPRLPYGYVRTHLDTLYAFATISDVASSGALRTRPSLQRQTECSLSLADVSVFAFDSPSNDVHGELAAAPILIADIHLPSQYPSQHIHPDLAKDDAETHMPTFYVADWTHPSHKSQSTRLSHWRTKVPHSKHGDAPRLHEDPRSPGRGSPRSPPSAPGRQDQAQREEQLALKVNVNVLALKVPSSKRSHHKGSVEVRCDVFPLHVLLDAGAILEPRRGGSSPLLQFVEELTAPETQAMTKPTPPENDHESSDDEDDGATPPGSPRDNIFGRYPQHRDHERERRRLEQLVIEDLNLDLDYRHGTPDRRGSLSSPSSRPRRKRRHRPSSSVKFTINVPMIRVQVRVPPPPRSTVTRSGAIVLDIHGLQLCPGEPPAVKHPTARFADNAETILEPPSSSLESAGHVLLTSSFLRVIIAHCPTGSTSATALVSFGALPRGQNPADTGAALNQEEAQTSELTIPHVVVSKSDSVPQRSRNSTSFVTTAIALEIPSVYVYLSKPQLDGLQLWADDLTQLTERAFSDSYQGDDDATERRSSKDPSLIGSRFFAKLPRSRSGVDASSTASADPTGVTSETIVKVAVGKVALRVALPRLQENGSLYPFDVVATDVDLLLESKPEGKEETVVTLGMMDASIFDHTSSGQVDCYLSLTVPRHMLPSSKPLLKLRFTSLIVPGTAAKESKVKVTLCGLTYNFLPDIAWIEDLAAFAKAPPGAFETVVPSERTHVSVKITDTSVRAFGKKYSGSVVLYLGETDFGTTIVGNSPRTSLQLGVNALGLFLTDDIATLTEPGIADKASSNIGGIGWKREGYALLAELANFNLQFSRDVSLTPPDTRVYVNQGELRLHLCADTATALTAFIADLTAAFAPPEDENAPPKKTERKGPTSLSRRADPGVNMIASLDEQAFARAPDLISAPDMIQDDLPTNMDYLDDSFSAAAGLRELTDDDFDEFGINNAPERGESEGVVAKHGGETIRMLRPQGLNIIEHHFDTLPPDTDNGAPQSNEVIFKLRVRQFDATLFLYDGYDWVRTRRIIEEERKNMRRKLAKIRQLVASGQTPDPSVEETNTLLFNSVYIGLEHNVDELEADALLAAIDDELAEDQETASQSSWQSFVPPPTSPKSTKSTSSGKPQAAATHGRHKVSKRSRGPSIEFRFVQASVDFDQYRNDPDLASRVLVTVRDVEILDHIKTSTWRKFLTSMVTDSKGNIRETDSNMVRVELRQVFPAPGHATQEARLRMKILPLRLHVDQDALDFLKKFFSFKDPDALPSQPSEPADETFFQQAEVFPVDLKLDYKPRRVDYRALRDGRTIELMNFFHFDGAEMTLRHITLTGITGWAKVFDLLNDLWTPDVKATQLVDVISGVAPIRSVVNVGSGVADLVLLPIAQYRKDGRVVRGLQKGTKAFVKSTAMEAIKLGARLATGTQVILEQAENVLGGQFKDPVTAETVPIPSTTFEDLDEEDADLISRYADQPTNVKEGVQFAYESLRTHMNSAAQTILAVPMEVYERSGNEGTVRAVVRAVPIAVLKPMIGASEAISKTLLGLHNTLDPGVRVENEAKYKQR